MNPSRRTVYADAPTTYADPSPTVAPPPTTHPTTVEPPSQGESLLDEILRTSKAVEPQEQAATLSIVQALINEAVKLGRTMPTDLSRAVKSWIALIDYKLNAQINEILHHPDFQKLESAWRGLHYLVHRQEKTPTLQFRVLSATRQQLLEDFENATEFDQSGIWKKVYENEFGQLGGKPFGLLVSDLEFGNHPEDDYLLRHFAQVAACAFAPFVAAVSPKMFNPRWDDFSKINEPRNIEKSFEGVEYTKWRAFRDREDSRFVALTLPRVLARLPYSVATHPIPQFPFEEEVGGQTIRKYLWMSAAWAYAARVVDAFVTDGWFMRTCGVEGGGKVEGLPMHAFVEGGGRIVKSPLEVMIPDKREFELSTLGFLPLVQTHDGEAPVFLSAQSCQKAKRYSTDEANANAELSTKINYLLCVSRFAHYLKVIGRNKIGSGITREELKQVLTNWLDQYVHPSPQFATEEGLAEKPLRGAKVELEPVPGKPGWYQAVVHLQPHFQLEGFNASMRLAAEMPGKIG